MNLIQYLVQYRQLHLDFSIWLFEKEYEKLQDDPYIKQLLVDSVELS